jgi:hypothetical protein
VSEGQAVIVLSLPCKGHARQNPISLVYNMAISPCWNFVCKHHMDLEMAAKPYLENYWEVLDTDIFWVNLNRIDWWPKINKGIEISDPTTY